MAKQKYDGIIESVRVDQDGQLEFARLYERRGGIFLDYVLVKRDDLIQRLKENKKIYSGKRVKYQGSSFEVNEPLNLIASQGQDVLVLGTGKAAHDDLKGLPRF